MLSLLLIVVISFCSQVTCLDRKPTISFITQPEIISDIGETIALQCSVQYAGDFPVVWMKLDRLDRNNDLVLTSGTTIILTDPRFDIDFEKSSSTYTLKISDLQETDGAIYQCQVLLSISEKVTADVPVIVRQAPVISDNSSRSVVATEGSRVELHCYASGYPQPEIYWRRQNNAALPNHKAIFKGNDLEIPVVKKEHRGTYYCVATNAVGHGARRNIDVEVQFKPSVKVGRRRVGQALQYDADLECHVEAYPPPAIQWYLGETLLSTNQHFSISHFAFDDEYTNTILRVITIEKKQFAEYTCKAINVLGEAEGRVSLFETVIPICPPACEGYSYSTGGATRLPITSTWSTWAVLGLTSYFFHFQMIFVAKQ